MNLGALGDSLNELAAQLMVKVISTLTRHREQYNFSRVKFIGDAIHTSELAVFVDTSP
jgi:class 3 adenylate cyclase